MGMNDLLAKKYKNKSLGDEKSHGTDGFQSSP